MSTIKELEKERIDTAYLLAKFALRYKSKDKKVCEVFSDVADYLSYASPKIVSNIYYKKMKEDPEANSRFKHNQRKTN